MSSPTSHSFDNQGNMYTHYTYQTCKQSKRLEVTVWPETDKDKKIVLHSLPGTDWKQLFEISASMNYGYAGCGRFYYVTDEDGQHYYISFTKLEE